MPLRVAQRTPQLLVGAARNTAPAAAASQPAARFKIKDVLTPGTDGPWHWAHCSAYTTPTTGKPPRGLQLREGGPRAGAESRAPSAPRRRAQVRARRPHSGPPWASTHTLTPTFTLGGARSHSHPHPPSGRARSRSRPPSAGHTHPRPDPHAHLTPCPGTASASRPGTPPSGTQHTAPPPRPPLRSRGPGSSRGLAGTAAPASPPSSRPAPPTSRALTGGLRTVRAATAPHPEGARATHGSPPLLPSVRVFRRCRRGRRQPSAAARVLPSPAQPPASSPAPAPAPPPGGAARSAVRVRSRAVRREPGLGWAWLHPRGQRGRPRGALPT